MHSVRSISPSRGPDARDYRRGIGRNAFHADGGHGLDWRIPHLLHRSACGALTFRFLRFAFDIVSSAQTK